MEAFKSNETQVIKGEMMMMLMEGEEEESQRKMGGLWEKLCERKVSVVERKVRF